MAHYPSISKYCATCELWSGSRKPDMSRKGADTENNAEGLCFGPWKNSKRKCNQTCGSWKKWAVLN